MSLTSSSQRWLLWILGSLLCLATLTSCGTPPTTVATAPEQSTLIQRQWIPDTEARCATEDPDPKEVARAQQRLQQTPRISRQALQAEIPIAVHVIYSGSEGNLPLSVLNDQLDVINAAFVGTGFSFRIDSIDRTDDAFWYNMQPGSLAATQAKNALNISPETRLNLYTTRKPGNLGFATFPWSLAVSPSQDGIVISYDSVPGGSRENFNEGDTAVHEIGHWLGLFHTFQGGCFNPGDSVFDTPYEGIPSEGCPINRDTCPVRFGTDPIFNFMDYSDDDCMNRFSAGQVRRMRLTTQIYRSQLLG